MIEYTCQYTKCNKIFSSSDKRRKYCSRRCACLQNNNRNGTSKRIGTSPSGYVTLSYSKERTRECILCESPSHGTTCSHVCMNIYKRFLKLDAWTMGLESLTTARDKLPSDARTLLLESYDYKCSKCGWGECNPLVGKPILTIDHIDGNWKNNFIWNLEVLCYNCHTLTPTFGVLNKGSQSGTRNYMNK